MPSITERLKQNPKLALGVKQYRAVLDFTTALEDEMVRRDISQSEFARLLGKTRAWVSKVFRSKPNLSFFTAVELADALDMDVHVEVTPRHGLSAVSFTKNFHITNLEPANTPSEMLPTLPRGATSLAP